MPRTNNKGSAMVFVLAIILITFLLISYMLMLSKEMNQSASLILEKLETKLEAESVAEISKFLLLTSIPNSNYFKTNSSNIKLDKLYIDGTENKLFNSKIKIYDSSGKLSLWYLNLNVLKRILNNFLQPEESAIIIDSIKDWIDKDNLKNLNGAEDYYYKMTKGYPYSCRNSNALQSVQELSLIRGITENVFNKIKHYFVLRNNGNFNISTANKDMLKSYFDFTDEEINELMEIKKENHKLRLNNILRIKNNFFSENIVNFPSKKFQVEITTQKNFSKTKINFFIDTKIYENNKIINITNWQE